MPTTNDVDKSEEYHAGHPRESLTLKKAVAYVCVVIIVVTLCFSFFYLLSQF